MEKVDWTKINKLKSMVKTRSQRQTKKDTSKPYEEKEKKEEEKKEELPVDCTICYDKIKNPGKLDCCEHVFCYDCILHWSEVSLKSLIFLRVQILVLYVEKDSIKLPKQMLKKLQKLKTEI